MVNTPVRPQRDPVARATFFLAAGLVAWLATFAPGIPAQAEQPPIILIATPTLPALAAPDAAQALQEAPRATEAPTPDTQPAVELVAPTMPPPEVVYVEVPAPAPPPEVVYVEVPASAPVEAAPEIAPAQDLLSIEQAAAEAHKDLPTVYFDNTPITPNHHPMPRGAGSR